MVNLPLRDISSNNRVSFQVSQQQRAQDREDRRILAERRKQEAIEQPETSGTAQKINKFESNIRKQETIIERLNEELQRQNERIQQAKDDGSFKDKKFRGKLLDRKGSIQKGIIDANARIGQNQVKISKAREGKSTAIGRKKSTPESRFNKRFDLDEKGAPIKGGVVVRGIQRANEAREREFLRQELGLTREKSKRIKDINILREIDRTQREQKTKKFQNKLDQSFIIAENKRVQENIAIGSNFGPRQLIGPRQEQQVAITQPPKKGFLARADEFVSERTTKRIFTGPLAIPETLEEAQNSSIAIKTSTAALTLLPKKGQEFVFAAGKTAASEVIEKPVSTVGLNVALGFGTSAALRGVGASGKLIKPVASKIPVVGRFAKSTRATGLTGAAIAGGVTGGVVGVESVRVAVQPTPAEKGQVLGSTFVGFASFSAGIAAERETARRISKGFANVRQFKQDQRAAQVDESLRVKSTDFSREFDTRPSELIPISVANDVIAVQRQRVGFSVFEGNPMVEPFARPPRQLTLSKQTDPFTVRPVPESESKAIAARFARRGDIAQNRELLEFGFKDPIPGRNKAALKVTSELPTKSKGQLQTPLALFENRLSAADIANFKGIGEQTKKAARLPFPKIILRKGQGLRIKGKRAQGSLLQVEFAKREPKLKKLSVSSTFAKPGKFTTVSDFTGSSLPKPGPKISLDTRPRIKAPKTITAPRPKLIIGIRSRNKIESQIIPKAKTTPRSIIDITKKPKKTALFASSTKQSVFPILLFSVKPPTPSKQTKNPPHVITPRPPRSVKTGPRIIPPIGFPDLGGFGGRKKRKKRTKKFKRGLTPSVSLIFIPKGKQLKRSKLSDIGVQTGLGLRVV